MSSPSFNATLDLKLKPSLRAVQVLLVLHIAAVSLVLLAEPPGTYGVMFSTLLLASWFLLRRHPVAGYGSRALNHLVWPADAEQWRVETPRDLPIAATLLPSSFVSGSLVVLTFRLADGKYRSRALFGDELDEEALRRLRARLLLAR